MAAASSVSAERESETALALELDSFTLYSFVDEVEGRIEALRKQATALSGEQASLSSIIDQLKHDCLESGISPEDCQELLAHMERLKARCDAVQVLVGTVRDEGQQVALQRINAVLREVGKGGLGPARCCLNACLPDPQGPVDASFQSLVLGCALDDQKEVRQRLSWLVADLASASARDSLKDRLKDKDSHVDIDKDSYKVSDKNNGKDSDKDNPKVSDKNDPKVSDKDSGKDSDKDNPKDSDKDSSKVSDKDNPKDSDKDNLKDNDKDSSKDSDKDNPKDSDKDNPKDSDKDSGKDSDKYNPKALSCGRDNVRQSVLEQEDGAPVEGKDGRHQSPSSPAPLNPQTNFD